MATTTPSWQAGRIGEIRPALTSVLWMSYAVVLPPRPPRTKMDSEFAVARVQATRAPNLAMTSPVSGWSLRLGPSSLAPPSAYTASGRMRSW